MPSTPHRVDPRVDAQQAETPARSDAVGATVTASRALVGVIARSLAPVVDTVTVPQLRALVVLTNLGPMRAGELADHLGANQSSVTRLVDRMVAADLLSRAPGTLDRREVIVSPTEHGSRVLADVTAARRQEISAVLTRLTATEQDTVRAGFELFARAAGEPNADQLFVPGV